MIGVEGGGQIDDSLSVLRAYHELGAGYLTLTHVADDRLGGFGDRQSQA